MPEYDAGTVKATMTADSSGVHAGVERVKKDYKDLAQAIADAMRTVKKEESEANKVERERQRELQETARKAREAAQIEKQAAQERKEAYRDLGLAAGVSFTAITAAIWKSTQVNNQLKASMAGLDSVATGNIGSYEKIKQELQQIQADGLIPLTNATQAYKNLISRYQDEDTAIKMFHKIADAAAFGRQAHLSLGEAIQGTSEGLKNEMSNMTDNGGITKNLSLMWKDYAAQIGKTVGKLTEAEKRQAEVNGFMEEGRFQTGDLAKLQQQLGGQMAKASAETTMAAAAFGDALEPAMTEVVMGFSGLMKGVREFIQSNPGLVAGITTAALATTGLVAATSAWIALDLGKKIAAGFTALTGPAGIAMIALSALAAVVVGLSTAEAKAKEENEKFYGSLRGKADDIGGKAVALNDLIKQYDELKTKAGTSKQAQQELQDVVKQIGQIAPEAVTQWDNLGNAVGISGEKAKQAVKDMLKARKDLLEVSLAREKLLTPGYQATISRAEAPDSTFNRTKKEVDTAQKELKAVYDKYSGYRQWFLTYFAADQQTQADMVQEGLDKGYITDTGNVLGSYYAIDDKVQKAETKVRETTEKFEKIGKEYFDAKQKLAENAATVAELQAIVDQGAGLETVKPKKTTNSEPPPPLTDEEQRRLEKQAELKLKLEAESLEAIGAMREAALKEEELRYEKEKQIAKGNKALLAEAEQNHQLRIYTINREYDQKDQEISDERLKRYQQAINDKYQLERNLTDWQKQELLKRMQAELDTLLEINGASIEEIQALQMAIDKLSQDTMPNMEQKTAEWGQELIDSMASAIAHGESLNDVFKNLLASIAEFVIKTKILQPLLGGLFGGLMGGDVGNFAVAPSSVGVPTFHSGGMITDIMAPVRAHTGMMIGELKRDEVPIIAQTGERVLNRKETAAYEAGKSASGEAASIVQQQPIINNYNISAMDAQSFAAFAAQNHDAIGNAWAINRGRNGAARRTK